MQSSCNLNHKCIQACIRQITKVQILTDSANANKQSHTLQI